MYKLNLLPSRLFIKENRFGSALDAAMIRTTVSGFSNSTNTENWLLFTL